MTIPKTGYLKKKKIHTKNILILLLTGQCKLQYLDLIWSLSEKKNTLFPKLQQ